jgi:hypothetical protein
MKARMIIPIRINVVLDADAAANVITAVILTIL